MRLSFKAAATVAVLAIVTSSAAIARPHPVQLTDLTRESNLIEEAGLAQKKAATKAWFKRKGNQTANWFNRQKNKVERKLAD